MAYIPTILPGKACPIILFFLITGEEILLILKRKLNIEFIFVGWIIISSSKLTYLHKVSLKMINHSNTHYFIRYKLLYVKNDNSSVLKGIVFSTLLATAWSKHKSRIELHG